MKISPVDYMTVSEYLTMERSSYDVKHEYYDGNILEMPGTSMEHSQIVLNLTSELAHFVKGKPFFAYASDFRVASPQLNSYVYPDASIVSGEPVLEDDKFDTLLNPSVIFEVLSTYSKKRDMIHKYLRYQKIPTVNEYIIIDSQSVFIQIARRQKDDSWKIVKLTGDMGASLFIETIQLGIPLNDIYYRVDFNRAVRLRQQGKRSRK